MPYTIWTIERYSEAIKATPADRLSSINGASPGGVAAKLGITRQAVHDAIKRGSLHAYKLVREGRVVAIIIPDDDVQHYRRNHLAKRA